jgi:TolB protein
MRTIRGTHRLPGRRLAWLSVLALAGCAGLAGEARAQAEVYTEIRKGELVKTPIAIEDFTWREGTPVRFQGEGEGAEQILAWDLVYTDAFRAVRLPQENPDSPGLVLDVQGLPLAGPVRARVRGEMRRDGARFELKATLVDEGSGSKVFERGYKIDWDATRQEADRWGIHRLADDVTYYLTGSRGCAATRIAFVRAGSTAREIWLADWDGFSEQPLTELGAIILSPAWHPSGRWVAYTSFHFGQPAIMASDLERNEVELVTRSRTPGAPAYAPDGKSIAYSSTEEGNAELYVARADGSRPRRITFDPEIDTEPSWSPSGRRLVFTSGRWGKPQLFTVSADGSDLAQITFEDAWCGSPDWSPTGDRIVHVIRIDGSFELALIHADGTGWQRLTVGGGCENPHWAPDGRHVIFSRTESTGRGLMVIDVETGTLRRLTALKGDTYNPAWSLPARERLCLLNPGG